MQIEDRLLVVMEAERIPLALSPTGQWSGDVRVVASRPASVFARDKVLERTVVERKEDGTVAEERSFPVCKLECVVHVAVGEVEPAVGDRVRLVFETFDVGEATAEGVERMARQVEEGQRG